MKHWDFGQSAWLVKTTCNESDMRVTRNESDMRRSVSEALGVIFSIKEQNTPSIFF